MKQLLTVIVVMCMPVVAAAAGGGGGNLDSIEPDLSDQASLQRGAQIFTNNCMGCHSAEFSRYKRVAKDLGIPQELYEKNLIFTDARFGQLMKIGMPEEDAESWFGNAPPDLTLTARVNGPDWLYSYLRAFYEDDTRPHGVNNAVFDNVGMPHVMVNQGGLCAEPPHFGEEAEVDPSTGEVVGDEICDDWAIEGSMEPEEFDRAMYDLTNFLVYLGEPAQMDRKRIGVYVLIFIGVFFIFAYLLNREYWKDIH
ncbi:MAG: cytochrome c1 [Halospina sp.]